MKFKTGDTVKIIHLTRINPRRECSYERCWCRKYKKEIGTIDEIIPGKYPYSVEFSHGKREIFREEELIPANPWRQKIE